VKKLAIAFLSCVLVLSLSSCKCTAEKAVVSEFRNSHTLLMKKLMKYVNADQNITGNPNSSEEEKKKARADWQGQVDKDLENIDKLEKALGK
jgi:hypothetical protein